jgi:hypothetical protein
VILEVGEPVSLEITSNWLRGFPNGDGSWTLFYARAGDYYMRQMQADGTFSSEGVALTGRSDLTDHSITRCPDGTWLHIASYKTNTADDSIRGWRYSESFGILTEAVIVEGSEIAAFNDPPLLCTDSTWGFPGQPQDETASEGPFYFLDEELQITGEALLGTLPPFGGSSFIHEPETNTVLFVRTPANRQHLLAERYDMEMAFLEPMPTQVIPEGNLMFWPQGVVRVGDYYAVVHLGRDEDDSWTLDTGDVWVHIMDGEWNEVDEVQVTALTPPDGAQRPGIAVQGDQMLVFFDLEIEPYYVSLTIDPAVAQPIADAGPDLALLPGESGQLDGSASRHGTGLDVSSAWSLLSGPDSSPSQLDDPTSLTPIFSPSAHGRYELELDMSDADASAVDRTVVVVNTPPTLDLRGTELGEVGQEVHLDASASADADGDELSYQWIPLEYPEGATIPALSGARPAFSPDLPGIYRFRLVLSDGYVTARGEREMAVALPVKEGCQTAPTAGPWALALLLLRRRRAR